MRKMLNNRFKTQLASVLTLLFAWVAIICVVPQPTHACCQKSASTKAEMPCCMGKATTTTIARLSQPEFKVKPLDLALASNPIYFQPSYQTTAHQSALASAWVPDQSDRYLELRVLLN